MAEWGQVVDTSPLTVKVAPDGTDKPIALKPAGYTPVNGDKVMVEKAGARWAIVCKLVAS